MDTETLALIADLTAFAKAEAERAGAALERQQSSYKRRVGAGGKLTPIEREIEAHFLDRHHQASLLLARGKRWLDQHREE